MPSTNELTFRRKSRARRFCKRLSMDERRRLSDKVLAYKLERTAKDAPQPDSPVVNVGSKKVVDPDAMAKQRAQIRKELADERKWKSGRQREAWERMEAERLVRVARERKEEAEASVRQWNAELELALAHQREVVRVRRDGLGAYEEEQLHRERWRLGDRVSYAAFLAAERIVESHTHVWETE